MYLKIFPLLQACKINIETERHCDHLWIQVKLLLVVLISHNATCPYKTIFQIMATLSMSLITDILIWIYGSDRHFLLIIIQYSHWYFVLHWNYRKLVNHKYLHKLCTMIVYSCTDRHFIIGILKSIKYNLPFFIMSDLIVYQKRLFTRKRKYFFNLNIEDFSKDIKFRNKIELKS